MIARWTIEDREPVRQTAALAPTRALDQLDERRETHRDQRADVDEQQRLARHP